ncbi:AAA family ATPase [uncultured Bacteroides sp.]|uniref:ATP-dependent DNA helicase n=1 Tax=uncultured Bacteroides sp. TaxID=162156 RepID=UPI002AAC03E9|nr:AAA family ATPase [uncultured Bacteroides sp.]
MINSYLVGQIKENFPHEPTPEQSLAVEALAEFLLSPVNDTVFILRGYAGTGKTTLVSAVVRTMMKLEQKAILLAPTGRAAKVLSVYSGHPAFTIHKKIYRQQSFSNELSNFSLNDNLHQHTLFIVDEASMISNDGLSGSAFGTGRLLDDLVQYVYSGQGCRLLLMGDTAQLPPVGEEESPALTSDVLKGYGLSVREIDLTQVVRQLGDSGILWNATALRRLIAQGDADSLPMIRINGFPDIRLLAGDELIEEISSCYGKVGMDETIVVCRSNKRANIYNKGIRNTILYREDELSGGDLLMVAKNNYFWTEKCAEIEFIANGDMAVVRRVRRTREMYGFRFADVQLVFPDYQDYELEATVLLDTLHTDAPALPKADNDRLFYAVLEDYSTISTKRERMKKMKADPYYNALQVKYGYAVTCHKAQGGQWKKVFLDQGYISPEMLTPDYFRWLYTAFTRATETLYLVNYPKDQVE